MNNNFSSAGHKLGQIVGDWYEEYFALPLLENISDSLGLYLDHRFRKRSCRGKKIIWKDIDNNSVDYDFALEIGGTDTEKGVPVAFFETFWRRGARHSKDKARDDSGKLMPMKYTYPTARVVGIISAGDFTEPAKEYVLSRGIELFYVDKANIVEAWKRNGIEIDYKDSLQEDEKLLIARAADDALNKDESLKVKIAETLKELVGNTNLKAYKLKLIGKLGAIPQRYELMVHQHSEPIVFTEINEVKAFLSNGEPKEIKYQDKQLYTYEVTFGDGDTYLGESLSWEQLQTTHKQIEALIAHMNKEFEDNE